MEGTLELPFSPALPKREKSKVAKARELVKEFSELSKQHGCLIPAMLLPGVLNLSRQRVKQFIDEGRLECVSFHGHNYIPEDAIVDLMKLERKHGRPFKAPTTRQIWEASKAVVSGSKNTSK